jgi:chromosome segregation ATPase
MINSSALDRQDPSSEILELESITLENRDQAENHPDLTRSRSPSTAIVKMTATEALSSKPDIITQSITVGSTGEKLDIKAELDLLLKSLRIAPPYPPTSALDQDLISDNLAKIAAAAPIAHSQQLLAQLNFTREQLAEAHGDLQSLYQRNQVQIESVDTSVLQAKQIKFRTQQLARHSQNQIQKVQTMLGSLEQIRQEVVTNLAKFGGYEEIHAMLVQLEDTRHALVIAHDRLKTGQEAFYESLRAIQEQVALQSQDTEQKLRHDRASIQSLTETIAADRQQIAIMGVEMTLKLTDLKELHTEMLTMHGQIVEKSQTLQSNIENIDRGFAELSQSVQSEKEQFYELTAGTIDKADAMRSQFADIGKQIGLDREAIKQLKTEIESVRHNVDLGVEQQLHHFDDRYHELMSTWGELQVRQKTLSRNLGKFSTWLWILSFAVGVIFILLITILMSLK